MESTLRRLWRVYDSHVSQRATFSVLFHTIQQQHQSLMNKISEKKSWLFYLFAYKWIVDGIQWGSLLLLLVVVKKHVFESAVPLFWRLISSVVWVVWLYWEGSWNVKWIHMVSWILVAKLKRARMIRAFDKVWLDGIVFVCLRKLVVSVEDGQGWFQGGNFAFFSSIWLKTDKKSLQILFVARKSSQLILLDKRWNVTTFLLRTLWGLRFTGVHGAYTVETSWRSRENTVKIQWAIVTMSWRYRELPWTYPDDTTRRPESNVNIRCSCTACTVSHGTLHSHFLAFIVELWPIWNLKTQEVLLQLILWPYSHFSYHFLLMKTHNKRFLNNFYPKYKHVSKFMTRTNISCPFHTKNDQFTPPTNR